MIKQITNWFIGDYLKKTADIIEQARITLIYQILMTTFVLVAAVLPSLIINSHYIQLTRSGLVVVIFAILLFYLKFRQSVIFISHLMVAVGTANLIANTFFIFQRVDGVSYLLAVGDILFAFYFLNWSWVIFYTIINIGAVALFILLDYFNIYPVQKLSDPLSFDVFYISMLTIFILIVIMLRHFRIAFNLSSNTLKGALNQQKHLTQKYLNLSEEVSKARDKAEEINRLKTNFLNNMSHEIRTPLNGIIGIAQLIEAETDKESIKEYVDIQKKSGERLLNTINSILHLSRLEVVQPQLVLGRIEINQVVEECFTLLKVLAQQKRIDYIFRPSPTPLVCLGDVTLLHQVFNNLIGNAIKFTASGNVIVSVEIYEQDPDYLSVCIEDTGIGIAEEFLPKLFKPFLQESSGHGRQFQGSGLGLSIAKKYIELMGGDIKVESTKGIGSTFTALLPIHYENH